MKDIAEFEFYDEKWELANDETWDFYHDQLVAIRDKASRIVIAWVVSDDDCGHVDYKEFDTWADAEVWKNQK